MHVNISLLFPVKQSTPFNNKTNRISLGNKMFFLFNLSTISKDVFTPSLIHTFRTYKINCEPMFQGKIVR